jgi:predicted nucleic acid-binding protein
LERVFVDTGFWYALNDRRDPAHERAVRASEGISLPLVTTKPVLWETLTLLRAKTGHAAAVGFGTELLRSPALEILDLSAEDERKAWRLFVRYDDQEFSFTDCLSFALMKRLGIRQALAFDKDFAWMGFRLP